MKRFPLKSVALYTRNLLHPPPDPFFVNPNPKFISPILPLSSISSLNFKFFSSSSSSDENGSDSTSNQTPDPVIVPVPEPTSVEPHLEADHVDLDSIEDVRNKDLKTQIDKYFEGGDEELLPTILESILKRKLKGKHEDTDDEAVDELRMTPLNDVKDEEFESDFEDAYETDGDIENLYDARDIVQQKLVNDEYFNMDDKKWDAIVKDAMEHGHLKDTKECEEILEDMLMWENVIPDSIKKKLEKEYNKIASLVASGELTHEQGLEIYQEFEDKMLEETANLTGKDIVPQSDNGVPDKKKDLADPPGQGPILRWQTRVVFAPGGDAWHPKNRKVKLAVTVKELGLSKVQFRRLRELVGKRYHSGKDELTITSERFEHREENRKDCLRTLFSLIEEAGKARIMVEEARTSYIKNKLRANHKFMEKLLARKEASTALAAS